MIWHVGHCVPLNIWTQFYSIFTKLLICFICGCWKFRLKSRFVTFSQPTFYRAASAAGFSLRITREFPLLQMTNISSHTHRYITTITDDSLWRDRGFLTTHLDHLPSRLPFDNGDSLMIDYARQSEVTSSLSDLVSEAAARGDNIGTDEATYQLESVNCAEIFTAKWVHGL